MRMKNYLLCALAAMLTHMFTVAAVFAEDEKPKEVNKNTTTYKVNVEVKEVKNRIVEGKVRGHTVRIDQPKEFGADDTAPTPPEMLAFALGSCVVSTGRLLAMQKNMNVRAIEATVEGELDFAKALGMETEKRPGYSGFKIVLKVDSDISAEEKGKFLREITDKCPMCDNLLNSTPITYELAK